MKRFTHRFSILISPHFGGKSVYFHLSVWQIFVMGLLGVCVSGLLLCIPLFAFSNWELGSIRQPSLGRSTESPPSDELMRQIDELFRQQQLIKSVLDQLHIPVPKPNNASFSVQYDAPVSKNVGELKKKYADLFEKAKQLQSVATGIPCIWPIQGPIASGFGYREHPIYGEPQFHQGIDIVAWPGTPIRVAADGTVSFSGWGGTYGYVVLVQHNYGFQTLYGHASEILVQKGDRVYQGQTIAQVGSTGLSTGAHLHYEVRRFERPLSPMAFLNGDVFTAASAIW